MLNRNKYKIMAVMLLLIIGLFAIKADINFVNYEVFDEMNEKALKVFGNDYLIIFDAF